MTPTPKPPATTILKGSKGRSFREQSAGTSFQQSGGFAGNEFKAKDKSRGA